jgi:hypothetical protein
MRCDARVSREIKARQYAGQDDLQGQPAQELDAAALTAVVETVARELIGSPRTEDDDEGEGTAE